MKHLGPTLLALTVALAAAPLVAGCKQSPATAGTGPTASDTLTLPLAQRKVGIRWIKIDDTTTDLKIGTGADAAQVGGKRHPRTANEILEVGADGGVTKVKLTYLERTDVELGPGAGPGKASPITGKSYIAWVEGGEVAATAADGSAVSSEELSEIRRDQDELGKPPVMEQIMARTWKVGVTVALTADELARLAASEGGGDGPRPSSITLTLRAVAGGTAEFAMTMKMESASPPLVIDAAGTAFIDVATGRPNRIDISGPVAGDAGGTPISGTMASLATYEFTDP